MDVNPTSQVRPCGSADSADSQSDSPTKQVACGEPAGAQLEWPQSWGQSMLDHGKYPAKSPLSAMPPMAFLQVD